MKKIFFSLIVIFYFTQTSIAQGGGIKFEKDLTWEQIMQKAQTENKYIFIDFYTTWCGPCKYMAKEIFPLKEVGSFFNNHFINISVQMNKTTEDAPEVRSWYSVADKMNTEFGINAYPTYVFLTADGKPVHRSSGAVKDPSEFLAVGMAAIDLKKQYYSVFNLYREHAGDSAYLAALLNNALGANDGATASKIANYYFSSITDPFSPFNLNIIVSALNSTKDSIFSFVVKNYEKIDSIGNNKMARQAIERIINREEISILLEPNVSEDVWEKGKRRIMSLYPTGIVSPLIAQSEMDHYRNTGQINKYNKVLYQIFIDHAPTLGNFALNALAWEAFINSYDNKVLIEALKWSKKSIGDETSPNSNTVNYIDTYANLLYKLNKVQEAIHWEEKAFQLANDSKSLSKIEEISTNLKKMKTGEKTW